MDNPMDMNINSGDNSMNSLSFFWLAIFKDGTYINQFEGEEEHRFQEVIDRFSDLKVFILHHKTRHDKFIVDLEKGTVGLGVLKVREDEQTPEAKSNIRLIYFRRHRVELSQNLKEKNHDIKYHLGLQWVNEKNENRNIILQIDENGEFTADGK